MSSPSLSVPPDAIVLATCRHRIRAVRGSLSDPLAPTVWEWEGYNLITTTGKGLLLDRLFGLDGAAALGWMGVGSSATAATTAQTSLLGGEVFLTAASSIVRVGLTTTVTAAFAQGDANFQWNEGAIFNGATNAVATMFNRLVIGPYAKTAAASIEYAQDIVQA